MKRLTCLLVLLMATSAFPQRSADFSVTYLARSVGAERTMTLCDDTTFVGPRPFVSFIDTLNIVEGGFTWNIRWRWGSLNGVPGTALRESTFTGVCTVPIIGTNNWIGSSFKIFYNGGCPLLRLFDDSSKLSAANTGWGAQTTAYDVFGHQLIPTSTTDSVPWFPDVVWVKQPYICWDDMTQVKADSMFAWYLRIRDSVWNHPEIAFVADFGSPNTFNTAGANFDGDTLQARYAYRLAEKFDSAFIDNYKPWEGGGNFFAVNAYTALCKRTEGSPYRYCLDSLYLSRNDNAHLNGRGMVLYQDTLRSGLKRIIRHKSMRKPGKPGITQATNCSSDVGWPMNVDNWPSGVPKTQARADSILAYQDTLAVSRYERFTNGDYRRVNGIKGLDSTVLYFEYNSFQDNYHVSSEEATWLADTCATLGISQERLYLHYNDSSVIVLSDNVSGESPGDTVRSIPGVAGGCPLADSTASRLLVYYAAKSRAVPNYADSVVRALHVGYARYQLERKQTNFNWYPDAIFWDNFQPAFWNHGTIVLGGHIAEIGGNPLVSAIGSGGLNLWYPNYMKETGKQFVALVDSAASWTPDGKARYGYGNNSGLASVVVPEDHSMKGLGQEFHPSIRTDYLSKTTEYRDFDKTCADSGVYNTWGVPVERTMSGATGSYTFAEAMMNSYCQALVLISDTSGISILTSVGWSNFRHDTIVWCGGMRQYIGEQSLADAQWQIAQQGVDNLGKNYTILKRGFGYKACTVCPEQEVFVYFRPRGNYNEEINLPNAVTVTFDGLYRELNASSGNWGDPVSSANFGGGRGRIFSKVSGETPPITSFIINTVALNFNGQQDSMMAILTFGTQSLSSPRAIVAHGVTNYPDSAADTLGAAYVASTVDTIYYVEDNTEPRVATASGWVKYAGPTWSERVEASVSISAPPGSPHIVVSTYSMSFTVAQNGWTPPTQSFTLSNSGDGPMTWTVTDNVNWLNCLAASGTGDNQTITVSITSTGLTPGTYNATISCAATGADNTPQSIIVTYTVTAQSTDEHVAKFRGKSTYKGAIKISKPGIPDPNDPPGESEQEPPAP